MESQPSSDGPVSLYNSIGPLSGGAVLNNPFKVLKQTVNVLVVDDMPEFWTSVKGLLDLFGIYYVHTAESTREALAIIKNSGKRFHACVLDRGMNDVERNEFYLIDKFGKTIPFIIMTARDDTEKTFECGRRGAKAFIRKDSQKFRYALLSALNMYALINLICPGYSEGGQSLLCRSVDLMTKNNPMQVKEWARDLDILESKLWKEWKKHMGVNPKYALCIFHVFSEIFNHVNDACANNERLARFDPKECGELLLNSTTYKRCLEYYLYNKHAINDYVSRTIPPCVTY
jgi:CheY-like chemotaxis protein